MENGLVCSNGKMELLNVDKKQSRWEKIKTIVLLKWKLWTKNQG